MVRFWDLNTGELLNSFEEATPAFYAVVMSPDRRWPAIAQGAVVWLWDTNTGELRWNDEHSVNGNAFQCCSSVTFSPNGQWLAAGYSSGAARLWSLKSEAVRQKPEIEWENGNVTKIRPLAISHDNQWLAAVSSSQISLQNLRTGVVSWNGPTDRIMISRLSFTPDFKLVTNLGIIDFRLDQCRPSWVGWNLYQNSSWLAWDNQRLLWLPSEYRPVASELLDHGVAMVNSANRLIRIEFSEEVSHYLDRCEYVDTRFVSTQWAWVVDYTNPPQWVPAYTI